VPGIAYGVIIDGELVHSGAFGTRDLGTKAPVDADTVFRIASMTKSFTAVAILRLRDEGRLSLDDPAEKYVPELAGLAYRAPTRRASPSATCCRTPKIPRRQPVGRSAALANRRADVGDDAARHPVLERARRRLRVLELRLRHLGRIVSRVAGCRIATTSPPTCCARSA